MCQKTIIDALIHISIQPRLGSARHYLSWEALAQSEPYRADLLGLIPFPDLVCPRPIPQTRWGTTLPSWYTVLCLTPPLGAPVFAPLPVQTAGTEDEQRELTVPVRKKVSR